MTANNKQLMQDVFAAMARGNTRPWVDLLADDAVFTVTGGGWARDFVGKPAILAEFYRPLRELLEPGYDLTLGDVHADGDVVVVEYQGRLRTKAGQAYENRYCLVCRLRDGKIVAVREYCDTLLVDRVLATPDWSTVGA